MTRIDFYTEVEDKVGFACRLAQKASRQNLTVVLLAEDDAALERASTLLWSLPPTGFTPHCRAGTALAEETPIVLARPGETTPHDQVLINLADARPADFSRFERLAEIVSTVDADRQQARERYRFYRDRGYTIGTHRMSEGATD
jgi:DNA polymerase-3 subunit chi